MKKIVKLSLALFCAASFSVSAQDVVKTRNSDTNMNREQMERREYQQNRNENRTNEYRANMRNTNNIRNKDTDKRYLHNDKIDSRHMEQFREETIRAVEKLRQE